MDWTNIISAVLAGGIAGQIVTLLWGDKLAVSREFNKWILAERYKLFSELLKVVTYFPKDDEKLNDWTYEIRDISQRIHILYKSGVAPRKLADEIERVFKLAQQKKDSMDSDTWADEMRSSVRAMRIEMAQSLRVG